MQRPMETSTSHLILHSGGLRSIIATAELLQHTHQSKIAFLFINDGRPSTEQRLNKLKKQADYFHIEHIHVINVPHLYPLGKQTPQETYANLLHSQLLSLASLQAIELNANFLIWPALADNQTQAVAKITQQTLILSETLSLGQESDHDLEIQTPLLTLTDAQAIELGAHLDIDWTLAWTCSSVLTTPCKQCPPCKRRARAFRQAHVVDSLVLTPA